MRFLPISSGQVPIDSAATLLMRFIVGVVQAEAFQRAEMCFNGVEPTGVCGSRHKGHTVVSCIALQNIMIVRGQVIHNEVYSVAFRITSATTFPGLEEIP